MHDREPAVFVEPLETHHRRVKAKSVGNPDRLALFDPELRPRPVRGIAKRHHGVQSVVPA